MTQDQHEPAAPAPNRRGLAPILVVFGMLLFVLFAGLGTWQVYRLQWKLALIERVNARVHAAPVAPPPPARWAQVNAQSDEYRHVRLAGTYLYEYTTAVQALSELGSGYWLLTPLCTPDGSIVLVNRGFVPQEQGGPKHYPLRRAQGPVCPANGSPVTISGLLRISEPGGGFLRNNDPAANRWYSRDVAAIASAHALTNVAPYFVDAGRDQDPLEAPDHPVGGLTVIAFHNSHLVYAITWYALALMVAAAMWWVARKRHEEDE
ncbi:SURF1 family protein [Massilia horti]|uniref:SURF1-like protein n=1 Tax=Massilia horti TaxID=2562153 RepID=A0A4Y9T5K8_9BURK|nr:SURF1 family protein [Massilia horti]TFW33733.1 SURF1 family protein [Massilia horti]